MTTDDWITRITEAPTDQVAYGYAAGLTAAERERVADQLHVGTDGLGKVRACRAIVAEARA
jgi:hypothetical protein